MQRLNAWRRLAGTRHCATGAVLTAIIAFGALPAHGQDVGLPIGSIPAAAEVEDLDGNAAQVASLTGSKPALLEFWATWCPLCAKLEPHLQEAKKTFADRVEFIVIAVGVNQTPRTIRRHIADHDVVGPVYFDRRGAAVRAFMTPTTSYVVILDAEGKVAYTGTGERQPISEVLARIVND